MTWSEVCDTSWSGAGGMVQLRDIRLRAVWCGVLLIEICIAASQPR